MDYHFTGTGDSPDFTFTIDELKDGLGNRIYYSAIKDIKIKQKGNVVILSVTTVVNGVKSEHRYSVHKEEEDALKWPSLESR